ncbi:MAG: hypothetical protein DWQ36_12830 [Acidobacteria bacterium]|nr:MAG: hypothetical protein DWQ36_12830 [Acidobacteriota bacterium]
MLSRGYGRRGARRAPALVVSAGDGEGPRVAVEGAGDEPYLLARSDPRLAVVVAGDRHRGGLHALEQLGAVDLFVLDDGFSHVALHRDLDLLAFPWHDPLGGGRLLPTGRLREPLAAAAAADAAVLTSAPLGEGEAQERGLEERLAAPLRHVGVQIPTFTSGLRVELATDPGDSPNSRDPGDPLDREPGGGFVLVTGVAAGGRVRASAEALGLEIHEHLEFADHHAYPAASLRRIVAACRRRRSPVLTTDKDAVKLAEPLRSRGLAVHRLTSRATPSRQLLEWLDRRVAQIEAAPG